MRRVFRVSAAAVLAVGLFSPRLAHATSAEEFPDNGSEQEGRGGAWVARASDPLATFYNPAGLAGQPTRLTLQANISAQHSCFTRVKATGDTTADGVTPGSAYPQVCSSGAFFPDPQLAFTYQLTPRIGLGIAVLGPSAVGAVTWPEFQGTSPSPQRYLLISSNAILLTPTIGIGAEVADGLRLGASFIFGTAPSVDFVNAAPGINEDNAQPTSNDIRNELKVKQPFIPGFTVGAIYSPASNIDLAGWFKWMGSINAKGDVTTASDYFASPTDKSQVKYGDTAEPYCYTLPPGATPPATAPCGNGNNGSVKVPIPMEAKIGVRYHQPRKDVPYDGHVRDPMATDVFDVELDFTYANDSAFQNLEIRFPANLPANPGIPSSTIPSNADVPHNWHDVFGVRLGGDVNVLPDKLALRAGGFFETQAANSVYQNLDFDAADRFGFALGGTYRIRLGSEKKQALEFMAGYGHVFFGTLSNNNPNGAGLGALAGTQCLNGGTSGSGCTNGATPYRTPWPVNLGTITSSINVINVGASYKF
jgi:long-subunit fatty acid transport protein